MKKEVIRVCLNSESHECDCCGSYWDETVEITFPDGNTVSMEACGHFGGGDWSGQKRDYLLYIAMYSGIKITEDGIWVKPAISEDLAEDLQYHFESKELTDEINYHVQYIDHEETHNYSFKGFYESAKLGRHELNYDYIEGQEYIPDEWDGSEEQTFKKILSKYFDIYVTR